jgi:hypothetical protein
MVSRVSMGSGPGSPRPCPLFVHPHSLALVEPLCHVLLAAARHKLKSWCLSNHAQMASHSTGVRAGSLGPMPWGLWRDLPTARGTREQTMGGRGGGGGVKIGSFERK